MGRQGRDIGAELGLAKNTKCGVFRGPPTLNIWGGAMGLKLHGMSATTEFNCWKSMLARCYNPRHKSFHSYGGRGITVCERWRQAFLNFYSDMGSRPDGRSLERINNDGNYEPENCRWATYMQQARNRRTNRYIEFNGERKILKDWAKQLGVSKYCLTNRLNKGWPLEKALTLKADSGRRVL